MDKEWYLKNVVLCLEWCSCWNPYTVLCIVYNLLLSRFFFLVKKKRYIHPMSCLVIGGWELVVSWLTLASLGWVVVT